MSDLTAVRSSRAQLEEELKLAGCTLKGNAWKCGFHDDNHPSGGVYQADGVWRFKCHGCGFCGDVYDVRARRLERPLPDVLRDASGTSSPDAAPKPKRVFPTVKAIEASVAGLGPVEKCYAYADPDTGAVQVVQVRYLEGGDKRFLTHQAAPGGFVLGAPPKPWPIYNRARIRAADRVVVVEGEKCVHALHDIGIVATTSLSGSANADKGDWSPLAGKKVYIWPDNDEAGSKYAAAVVAKLDALRPAPTIRMLAVTGLGLAEHGDVADFIADGATAEEVWRVLEDGSQPAGATADLFERIDAIITGTWKSIEWPWPALSRACKSLFPGTITVVCGDPSASKSFFLLEAMEHWHQEGIPVDLLELEEDRAFHLLRLLAIKSGIWDVLNDEWGRSHAAKLSEFYGIHEPAIQSFAPHLQAGGLGQLDYDAVLKWIEQRCVAGARILAIDPITAVSTGESRQIEDLGFIVRASVILRAHGARLILVTHPRQSGKATSSQDDVAGGRAYSRHTQTVLMLHRHDPAVDLQCRAPGGFSEFKRCNRSIRIAKARNAPGHGWRIGFNLGPDVRFLEHGVIAEQQN
jgi:hypothetical protein